MIIITYSETSAETIEQRLGKAEYSYYFIYKKYLPALHKIGRVVAVSDPAAEVDNIFREHADEDCIFLSFSPPHRTLLELQCPTVCVFAWEFSTIPEESWHGRPEYNWAADLAKIGNAITISQYAADVVERALPGKLNLAVVPAAVDTTAAAPPVAMTDTTVLKVKATLYDSNAYNLTTDMVNDEAKGTRDPLQMVPWDDQPVTLSFSEDNPDATKLLIGFYSAEEWGAWSRTKTPWILLPHVVQGPVCIEFEMVGYGTNIGREVQLSLGDETRSLVPLEVPQIYQLHFNPTRDIDIVKFSNIDFTHAPGARDHRSLGVGIKSMTIRRPDNYRTGFINAIGNHLRRLQRFVQSRMSPDAVEPGNELELKGVVYTTVMNPQDGRKNWEDMVTAFCWAFREEENATLVLKMTHHNLATFLGKLLLLFSQMSPFKCRVVAIHGFLTDEQYDALIARTHYVVNSSHCEGQCLPLMEFMGQGKPAIAPDHTAMADYVDTGNTFIVQSNLYPTYWPIDERKAVRTLCYRINWETLKNAFLESYDVVLNDRARYEQMQRDSIRSVEESAGQQVVYEKLRDYIGATARKSGRVA